MTSSENYYIINANMEIYTKWDQVLVNSGDAVEIPKGVRLPYHTYIIEASNLDRLMIMGKKKRLIKIIPPIYHVKIIGG